MQAAAPILLSTKLTVPRLRSALVRRTRLFRRLDEALTVPLTLVSAPAGWGKSTLLAAWLLQGSGVGDQGSGETQALASAEHLGAAYTNLPDPRPLTPDPSFAWLSLDDDDNDPARFWGYVAAGLGPLIGLDSAAPVQIPAPDALMAPLLNAAARLEQDLVLVLDDYHVIRSPAIHQALALLIDRLPPRLHLIIATRSDPPLPLPRLRARGDLVELRANNLRFSHDEASQFLSGVMQLELDAARIALLEQRAEGWIAGLQLAALSLREGARADVSFDGGHRFVVDYLVDEVLSAQPAEIQSFLLRSSILERMEGSLCDALLGEPERRSAELLEYLERANLFVVALDDRRRWYRYHHLFAAVLRERIQRSEPELVPELHRRAAAWLERNDGPAEAVRHALAGADWDGAARLIETCSGPMLTRGEWLTLQRWFEALPPQVWSARPLLLLRRTWVLLLTGRLVDVEPALRQLERSLDPARPDAGALLGEIAALRAHAARIGGDYAGAIAGGREALERLPGDETMLRAVFGANLALALGEQGELDAAVTELLAAQELCLAADNVDGAVVHAYQAAEYRIMQGRLADAKAICVRVQELAAGQPPSASAGLLDTGLAAVQYERGDFAAADAQLHIALEHGRRGNDLSTLLAAYVRLAAVRFSAGDGDGARQAIDRAFELARSVELPPTLAQVEAARARLALLNGDPAVAEGWLERNAAPYGSPIDAQNEPLQLLRARLLLARRRLRPALELAQRIAVHAEQGGRAARLLEALVLQAVCLDAQGERPAALRTLRRAIALAEPEGWYRIFHDERPALKHLIEQLHAQVPSRLTAELSKHQPESLAQFSDPTAQFVEPLSARELDVLRLLAAGRSNREIAADLVLALGTVKKHVNNIFGKLGAANRTAAVARARELGLLQQAE